MGTSGKFLTRAMYLESAARLPVALNVEDFTVLDAGGDAALCGDAGFLGAWKLATAEAFLNALAFADFAFLATSGAGSLVFTAIVHFPFFCPCGAGFPFGGTFVAIAGFFGGGL